MLPFFGSPRKKKEHVTPLSYRGVNDKKRKSSVLGTSQKGELSGSYLRLFSNNLAKPYLRSFRSKDM